MRRSAYLTLTVKDIQYNSTLCYAECHDYLIVVLSVECCYAKCHYAECRFAECRCAFLLAKVSDTFTTKLFDQGT